MGGGIINQFEGFPPGIDVNVVIENIKSQVNIIGEVFIPNPTRQRRHRTLHGTGGSSINANRERELVDTSDSSNPTLQKKEEADTEIAIDKKVVSRNVQIAIGRMSTGRATDTTELESAIVGPLHVTIANPSYTNDVLSGRNSTEYRTNLHAVKFALQGIFESPTYLSLTITQQNIILDAYDETSKLFSYLEGVIEG